MKVGAVSYQTGLTWRLYLSQEMRYTDLNLGYLRREK